MPLQHYLSTSWGAAAADISPYTDMITSWAASANSLFLHPMLTLDELVFATITVLSMQAIAMDQQTTDDVDLPLHSFDEELCVLIDELEEAVCGEPSFDSTEGFACVEQWKDGKLRWVCA